MKLFAILLLLICGTVQADHDLTLVVTKAGYFALSQDASGNPSFHKVGQIITLGVPGPGPVVPPGPSVSLTETVKQATAAIPTYADKDTHRRSMAFGMSFIAQATANSPVPEARNTVKQFCNAAVAGDAPKWAAWWAAVDAKLDTMALTPATYTAALGEMAAALTADLPAADAKDAQYGQTYGLDTEFIKQLIMLLLPLILKLLGLQ
jgi:hypothetical protein